MRGGVSLPTARHALLLTSVARDSNSLSEALEILGDGFSTPVVQWALQVRGRNWFEGRIAGCPRLQQKRLSS